jgi:hypothetical protein
MEEPKATPAQEPAPATPAVPAAIPPAEIAAWQEKVATLEASLTSKSGELTEAKKSLDAGAADIASLKLAAQAAVNAYRNLAISTNPLFTPDLITGGTIEEINASVERVKGLLGRVRTHVEAELKASVVPAGAPAGRTEPDTSGLSPKDKISEGIRRIASKK